MNFSIVRILNHIPKPFSTRVFRCYTFFVCMCEWASYPYRVKLNWLFAIILAAEGMGIKCPSLFRYKWLALTFTWQLELSRCSLSHSANNPEITFFCVWSNIFSLFHLYIAWCCVKYFERETFRARDGN